MDAFVDSMIQLLIEWGLPGMFIAARLAGSVGDMPQSDFKGGTPEGGMPGGGMPRD